MQGLLKKPEGLLLLKMAKCLVILGNSFKNVEKIREFSLHHVQKNKIVMKINHGIVSISIIGTAILFASLYLFSISSIAGFIYCILLAIGGIMISYGYCAKCTCRISNCAHVLPGKLTKLFPEREQTDYTIMDHVVLFTALILIFGFPQFYLYQEIYALIAFWGLVIIGLIEISLFVCTSCGNTRCMACKNKKLKEIMEV